MSHKLRTPEQVCIAYAELAMMLREINEKIRTAICENYDPGERDTLEGRGYPATSKHECLDKFYALPLDDDGCRVRGHVFINDEMCQRCHERYYMRIERQGLNKRVYAAKRAVEAVGKRLKAVQP